MKKLLIVLIIGFGLVILNDVERNSTEKVLNYTQSIVVLPFLILVIYGLTHTDEIKRS